MSVRRTKMVCGSKHLTDTKWVIDKEINEAVEYYEASGWGLVDIKPLDSDSSGYITVLLIFEK